MCDAWRDLIRYWLMTFREPSGWILRWWRVRAALPWQWRHSDAECSLWSDEDRSVRQTRAGIRADVTRSAIPRMFRWCSRHR